jgi:hypothetical protein
MKVTRAAAATSKFFNIILPAPKEELFLLLQENISNPLLWSLLAKFDVPPVTLRIRKYVLNGDTNEAWRMKESYKDTFALEAVSVSILLEPTPFDH